LVHIGKKLECLHSAGWVHRDLKPSNTIWLPSKNQWALIDFGCAARAGADAPLSFSLQYAPPEVILAHKADKRSIVADASADVWALGVRCQACPIVLCRCA
jgi:serine/threonine protein kinase